MSLKAGILTLKTVPGQDGNEVHGGQRNSTGIRPLLALSQRPQSKFSFVTFCKKVVSPAMRPSFCRTWLAVLTGFVGLLVPRTLLAADHRDGRHIRGGPTELADLFVFRSPTNANNTVFVLTLSPFADFERRPIFQRGAKYELKIDQTGDGFEELTFQFVFGAPNSQGVQSFRLYRQPFGKKREELASGLTGTNIPIASGGMTRAALFDDPCFMDQTGLDRLVTGQSFPRPVGLATNFFGPNANVLGVVMELPSTALAARFTPATSVIGVWGRVVVSGTQVDRIGRPLINKLLVPPIPRTPVNRTNPELRARFNRGRPALDVAVFTEPISSVLQRFYGRTSSDATAISGLFLPDFMTFQLGNPNGFGTFVSGSGGAFLGNGRRLRDDVCDIQLMIFSNGAITTDNIADDNGTRITDGNMGTLAAFPYIGAANIPGAGPNP